MTYKQLMGEVAALGFEEGVEDESSFRYAANRALLQLANEYRTYCTAVFCLPAPRRHRLAAARTLCPGEYISLFCPAGGVSLRVGGRGILTADTGGKIARRIFERDDALFRLCLPEGGTLTVRADGYVMCGETAHYEGIFTREEDIPLPEGGRDILLSDIPDFLSAGELPADRRGTPVRGAEIIGNRLTMPAGCPGTVRLTYAHLPEKITADNKEEAIDVPPEAEHLLPLLTAAYLWLDADASKAGYYMSLYRDGVSRLTASVRGQINTSYGSTNAWA